MAAPAPRHYRPEAFKNRPVDDSPVIYWRLFRFDCRVLAAMKASSKVELVIDARGSGGRR